MPRLARPALVIPAILAVYLALALTMTLTKRPWVDEAWFSIPAMNLLAHGTMATTNVETAGTWLAGLDQYTYWITPLHFLTQAGWYSLFGFSVFSLRALSIVWGLIALLSLFVIVDRLTGRRQVAFVALALAATDYLLVRAASDGRMDMMNAALGFAALASYVGLRTRRLVWAVAISHCCAAASLLTHPNGVMPIAALSVLTLFLDRAHLQGRHVVVAAVPYVVGLSAWGAYILQAPQLFLTQFGGNAAGQPWDGLGSWFTSIWNTYAAAYGLQAHWAGPAVHLRALVLLAYLAGVIGVLATRALRRDRGTQALLLLLGTEFVLMSLMRRASAHDYLVHVVPLYAALLAVWIVSLWERVPVMKPVLASATAGLMLLQVGGVGLRAYVNHYDRQYRPLVEFLRSEVRPDDLIIGSAELGFGLGFTKQILDDTRIGFHSGRHPEYIVVDSRYQSWIAGYLASEPEVQAYVRTLLARQYEQVYAVETDVVYRCRQHRGASHGTVIRAHALQPADPRNR
jgi:4-amino-4-deoxy-L-arabinose transferase-like glycosyltransferase